MSLRSPAGYSDLYLKNEGRASIIFPGLKQDTQFSFSVWIRPHNPIPTSVITYNCKDGSQIRIISDSINWRLVVRVGTIEVINFAFMNVTLGRWALLCVAVNGPGLSVHMGLEDPLNAVPPPETHPVVLQNVTGSNHNWNSDFDSLIVAIANGADVCCFKFWNNYLTMAELQVQAQRWDDQTEGAGPAPIWVSPLRTTGDMGNVANPHAVTDWTTDFSTRFSGSTNVGGLESVTANYFGSSWPDPVYMGSTKFCPTWIFPSNWPIGGHCFIDPGTSPLVTTTYEAPQFFQFLDLGAVPIADFSVESIRYYGYPSSGSDGGWPHSETWGVYIDENEVKYNSLIPSNRFDPPNYGVTVLGPITPLNMYRWKFGAQFTYQPATPQQPTATASLSALFLLVTYRGWPTGRKFIPADDLSGLFAINKTYWLDTYNNGVALKIPDPTIRTAYIGE